MAFWGNTAGMAAALLVAVAPAAHAEPKAQLSIVVNDGHDAVRPGDRLTYTTTVTNIGGGAAPPLDISQTLGPGLSLVASTPAGTSAGGRVGWTRPMKAGESAKFTVTVDVGRQAPGTERLAVVSCAAKAGTGRPLVCATDSAPLTPAPVAMKTQKTPASVAWGAAAALVAVLGVLVWRRRVRGR
ncbi:hypothetical protein [Herbidospora sp. RD11066]